MSFFGQRTSTRSFFNSKYLMTASASKVFPKPTLSARMQPLCFRILLIAPLTPSRWNSKRACQIPVSTILMFWSSKSALFLIGEEIFKNVEERFVVDEFRRVILVKLVEVLQDFRFDVLNERRVVPQFIEPSFQVAPVAIAVHFQIEFDVVVARAEAEAAHGEIGTAKNGFLHAGIGDVIHLAVEKLGVTDGFDFHFLANPFGAIAGNALLLKAVGELQAIAIDDEGLFFGLVGIERGDETRLAEQEIQMLDLVEMLPQRVVGVDGEIGGDDREPRAGVNLGFEKIRD